MSYFKLRNAGALDRRDIFLIGGNKKSVREDDYVTIGQYVSGLKRAVIGALRLGLKLFITSIDQLGPYLMMPTVKTIVVNGKVRHQIWHQYLRTALPDQTSNPLQFPVEREQETPYMVEAFPDFTAPVGDDDKKIFKTLCELIANAFDEDKTFSSSYIENDGLRMVEAGETIVYLETNDDLIKILSPELLPRYFKIFENCPEQLHGKAPIGWIYPKSDPDMTRLFVRGVVCAALKDSKHSSCFDYSLVESSLRSEEGVIKNIDSYRHRVGTLLETLTNVDLTKMILEKIMLGEAKFENDAFIWSDRQPPSPVRMAWSIAWMELPGLGDKMILPSNNIDIDHRAIQKGYQLASFNLSSDFYNFLTACGIKTSTDVVPIQGQMDFLPADESELSPVQLAVHKRARQLLCQYFPKAIEYSVRLQKSKSGGNVTGICGFAGELNSVYKEICLNINHPRFDTLATQLHTLIHEYCHCVSKKTDFTTGFVTATVDCVVDAIFKAEIERNRHVKPKSP